LESAYASGGSTLLAFQSQYHDCGLPDRIKTWADLVVSHNTQGVTLTITCRQNKNANPTNDSFTLATFSSSAPTRQTFPLVYPAGYPVVALRGQPIESYNLSIRITGNGAGGSAPIRIESPIELHYYVQARFGRTFDSGKTNLGLEGVGSLDQIEVDIDASGGAATLVISSDIPGGVLAPSALGPLVIGPTTGRQVVRFCFANPVQGRLWRFQIASTAADFAVYGIKPRVLPLGVCVDGSQGDFWLVPPTSVGS
jgi:hypothetical protein